MESLRQELRVIDAQHYVDQRKNAEIRLLRILLRKARGEYTSVHDEWAIQDIVRDPRWGAELASHYGVAVKPDVV